MLIPSEFRRNGGISSQKTRIAELPGAWRKNFDDKFRCFDSIQDRDGRTDRQTDHRCKKRFLRFLFLPRFQRFLTFFYFVNVFYF